MARKTEKQPEDNRKIGNLRLIWGYASKYPQQIAAAIVFLMLSSGATLAIPYGFKRVIDQGFGSDGASAAAVGTAFHYLLMIVVVLAAATALRFYFVSWLGERTIADLRVAVQRNLLTLPPRFFEENRPSEIASRLTADTAILEQVIGSSVSIALRNIATGTGGIVYLFVLSPKLAAMLVIGIPIVFGPVIFFGRRIRSLSRASQDRIADVGSTVSETLGAMKVVQAFGQEERELRRFRTAVENAFSVARRRFTNARQAEDEPTECERRENNGEHIQRRLLRFGDVLHPHAAKHEGTDGDWKHEDKEPAPLEHAQDEPGHPRTDCWRERHHDRDVAHGLAARCWRHEGHDSGHEQRQHDCGTAGLHDATGQKNLEAGCDGSDESSHGEQRHGRDEDRACGEALDEETSDRDDNGHGEHERGREPLCGARGDAEVFHQARQRHAHDGLVEEYDEGGDQHEVDHQAVASAVVGSRRWCGDRGWRLREGGILEGNGAFGHRNPVNLGEWLM